VPNFDGVAKAGGGTSPTDLNIKQYNSSVGGPETFLTGVLDNATPFPAGNDPPVENYVSGVFGSAYHAGGGLNTKYDDGAGGMDPGPITQGQPVNTVYSDFWSYRDVLEPEPDESAGGVFNSGGGPNGGLLTYAFWLNIQGATRWVDGARFGTDTSFAIARSSDPAEGGNYGGQVGVRFLGADPVPEYTLQLRNDPGIVTTSAVTALQGDWHHYVVEYDLTGADGQVTVWQDGGPSEGGVKEVLGPIGNTQIVGALRLNNVAFNGAQTKESGDFYYDEMGIWVGSKLSDE
jgi:hypothetical protein